MSDLQEALFYLDLDKGGLSQGPLFESASERLASEPTLRAGWAQYQALRALAWEMAPEPSERELRQVLQACRRDHVGKRLAQATGSEDLARELLLSKPASSKGLPAWVWALLLIGASGLGWLSFQGSAVPFSKAQGPLDAQPTPVAGPDESLTFEFNALSAPADAALAQAPQEPGGEEEVAGEPASARQARLLLRRHLSAGASGDVDGPDAAAVKPAPAPKRTAPAVATRTPSHTPKPSPSATPSPSHTPSPLPTATLTAQPAAQALPAVPLSLTGPAAPAAPDPLPLATSTSTPQAQAPAAAAAMTLSSNALSPATPILITLSAPGPGSADLRLFDQRGRSVRRLAEGPLAPGDQSFGLDAKDDAGQALPSGTYYLRVMTPWFSRVEAVQVP